MNYRKKLHAKFNVVVAYDPDEPPLGGPVVIEIWTSEGYKYPEPSKKLGEMKLTSEETKKFYDGNDDYKATVLKKHKLMSQNAKFSGAGDGDHHSLFLDVSGDDEVDGLFIMPAKKYLKVLDAIYDAED